jgi:hypothetical protein
MCVCDLGDRDLGEWVGGRDRQRGWWHRGGGWRGGGTPLASPIGTAGVMCDVCGIAKWKDWRLESLLAAVLRASCAIRSVSI